MFELVSKSSNVSSSVSWGWRKLLSIRNTIRPFIWYKIGNGCKVSAWFDTWDANGPVMPHVSNRAIFNAGFTPQDSVADMVHGSEWRWPQSWFEDKLVWKSIDGSFKDFSVSEAWQSIRKRSNEVSWHRSGLFDKINKKKMSVSLFYAQDEEYKCIENDRDEENKCTEKQSR
ncbi:reverse transcriptase domain, Reverse transcriptase zinc-binding domain protein [Artemisia annua]|uniref:Reverse transcriptase domain, Reverse transcriptase zinc-binding domain protein n=1 Tax=Artemisia annua TaxID=35608 RepID=A0A2U1MR55_ARTAN|nr:reverse transcriptase domain, Reverse transcriptase zinc-binding domain protein [Artemisia annua]